MNPDGGIFTHVPPPPLGTRLVEEYPGQVVEGLSILGVPSVEGKGHMFNILNKRATHAASK